MKAIVLFLHRLASSSYLNFGSGLILLLCGALESFAILTEEMLGISIGAHHGIAFFGAIQMLKALPDFMKGVRFIDDGDRNLIAKMEESGKDHAAHADCAGAV
jgi:hypothetical protein